MQDSSSSTANNAEKLSHGDRNALASLFVKHRERLRRMVRFRMHHRLLGRVDPDDVLQEAYLAAASRLEHFRGDGEASYSPFVWLRLILMQTLVDMHRHHLGTQMRDAQREVGLPGCCYALATSASLAAQLIGTMTSPSQFAARAETLAAVEQAIGLMEPMDREILAMRHFEELTNSEIAEVLAIQPKAASIRYVRAVRRLRTLLATLPGYSEGNADG